MEVAQFVFLIFVIVIAVGVLILLAKLLAKMKGPLLAFWSCPEMRFMIAACVVILFAWFLLPSKFEVTVKHDFSSNQNNPINVQLSDRGYPVKIKYAICN